MAEEKKSEETTWAINKTRVTRTLNLIGQNAVHLYPLGTMHGDGKAADRALLLASEIQCPDVQNALRHNWIRLEATKAEASPIVVVEEEPKKVIDVQAVTTQEKKKADEAKK